MQRVEKCFSALKGENSKRRLKLTAIAASLMIHLQASALSGYLQTSLRSNSEDPDEMLHDAAFHKGLHCLQR